MAESVDGSSLRAGRMAVERGMATPQQVEAASKQRAQLAATGAAPLPSVCQILVQEGILSPQQHESLLQAVAAERPNGQAFGKYVKVAKLGAGGMGEVWKAWDTPLGRWVALKFTQHDTPQDLARFQREAQTAASLKHPGIVAIYEIGAFEGTPFIAMQFIEGKNLAEFPRDDRKLLVQFARDAALAVQAAHEQGVIHRDLKPSNLMVEGDHVVVTDFGLAKAMHEGRSLSLSASFVGTPSYMSPEQVKGSPHKVTAASDVYSLGATLYELLADRPPFVEKELFPLLKRIAEEAPKPVRRVNPGIDAGLEAIVMKCLEKEPSARYATARELADELTCYLSTPDYGLQSPVPSPPAPRPPVTSPPAPPPRKRLSRKHKAVGAGVIAMLITLVGLIVHAVRHRDTPPAETDVGPVNPPKPPRKGHASQGAELIASAGKIIAEAQAYVARAISLRKKKDLDGAIVECNRALELWSGCAEAYFERGLAAQDKADLAGAIADFTRAIVLRDDFEEAWASRGAMKFDNGDFEGALADLNRALALKNDDADAYYNRALVRRAQGKIDEAIADLDQVVGIRNDAEAFCMRGALKGSRGDYDGAIADCTFALRAKKDFAEAYFNRALAREKKGDVIGAFDDYTRAVDADKGYKDAYFNRALLRKKQGDIKGAFADFCLVVKYDPKNAAAYVNMGIIYQEAWDADAALAEFQKALDVAPANWAGRASVNKRMEECRQAKKKDD